MSRHLLPILLAFAMGSMPALAQEAGSEANADQQAADDLTGGEIDMSRIEQILKEDEEVWRGATFQYEPGNRRDPFRPLVTQGPSKAPEHIKRPDGLPGTMIEELIVEGTIRTPEGIIAFAQGRDGRAHIIRAGTKLFDGEVRDVQNGKVIFKQYINDPKSVTPYRDVVRDISVD